MISTTFVLLVSLLFGQVQTSHFDRLPYPEGKLFPSLHLKNVSFQGAFTMPERHWWNFWVTPGQWTIDYQKLAPGDYNKIPVRCSFIDLTDRATPIYDIDEWYDHITIQSEPGHNFSWNCTMAVPDLNRQVQ